MRKLERQTRFWIWVRDLRRSVSVLPSDRHRDRRKVMPLAERNARRLRRYAVRPEIVRADAAKYRVPDDITVVLLYNPFGSEVLKPALTRVLESFDRAPRRMQLAYANPREPELIASMPRYRTADKISLSWRPGTEWHRTKMVQFYEVEPQG